MIALRPERAGDEAAIFAVTEAAFTGHPHSEGTEPHIVDALRADGDMVLSLLAEEDGAVLGHAAYSPAILSDGSKGWWVLGPIAVAPARQGEGIGRALVEEGTRRARRAGASGIVLLGDPALYARFGFVQNTPITLDGPLAPYLQVLAFTDAIPAASVSFVPAFRMARVKDR